MFNPFFCLAKSCRKCPPLKSRLWHQFYKNTRNLPPAALCPDAFCPSMPIYYNDLEDMMQEDEMPFQTIIAAIEFNDDLAPGVLHMATMLARQNKAKLWVVDVWPELQYSVATGIADPLGATAMMPSKANLEADKSAKAERAKMLETMAKSTGVQAEAIVLDGEAAKGITNFAREQNADLIVVGTHQKGAWRALLDGAPSRDIVREAPCAILLVPKVYAEKIKA
jgi:nucleotide-binding universal stress UspA family protein